MGIQISSVVLFKGNLSLVVGFFVVLGGLFTYSGVFCRFFVLVGFFLVFLWFFGGFGPVPSFLPPKKYLGTVSI